MLLYWSPLFSSDSLWLTLPLVLLLLFIRTRKRRSSGPTIYWIRKTYQINGRFFRMLQPDPEDNPTIAYWKKIITLFFLKNLFERNRYLFAGQSFPPGFRDKILKKLSDLLQQYLLAVAVTWPSMLVIGWYLDVLPIPLIHVFFASGFFWTLVEMTRNLLKKR